jgi:secondary thiamine-phosphate synthase enzyme
MIRQVQKKITVETRARSIKEITDLIQNIVTDSGIRCGLVVIHLAHTSASLLIQENADPTVRSDLERFFSRLVPDGDPIFRHVIEGPDDMSAHIRTALLPSNLTIPVEAGTLVLGTWQGIYIWEHRNRTHHRTLFVHIIGE